MPEYIWREVEQCLPAMGVDVWAWDGFYDQVIIAHHNGRIWESDTQGDDIGVTHWMPLVKPRAPKGMVR